MTTDEEQEASHQAVHDELAAHFKRTNAVGKGILLGSRENDEDTIIVFAVSCVKDEAERMYGLTKQVGEHLAEKLAVIYHSEEK